MIDSNLSATPSALPALAAALGNSVVWQAPADPLHAPIAAADNFVTIVLSCEPENLPLVVRTLTEDADFRFAAIIPCEEGSSFIVAYWFYRSAGHLRVKLRVRVDAAAPTVPSISAIAHAADWHERQAEDLFGLIFSSHPKLGDFVLHEQWREGVNPMRRQFDHAPLATDADPPMPWSPETILETPGAFVMPIGPVYSDYAESAQFFLETVGEDVVRMIPRFFYKYRAVEKLAEGQSIAQVLLKVERFSGTSAVAHAICFSQAVEQITAVDPPPRAQAIRLLLAELERIRHHLSVLSDVCHSTGMIVPSAQVDILEEQMLRLSCRIGGHRYLYGLVIPGGLRRNIEDDQLQLLADEVQRLRSQAAELFSQLQFTSSFLDRFEGVGITPLEKTKNLGLVGPVARASNLAGDLRIAMPYGYYHHIPAFPEALETEGDGYARIRVLFHEIDSSAEIIRATALSIPPGEHALTALTLAGGEALGAVEAPNGAAFHGVNLAPSGTVRRLALITPSFTNWHGFHLAAENFAFQDFPIMMATFGLSMAESDR